MRAKVLQIVWHSKEPLYSLDFHPDGVLATAGGDKEIKLWNVGRDKYGVPEVQYRTSLAGGHTRTVNCLRFSPTGEHLATGGDGGELFLWKVNMEQLGDEETKWGRSILRSHTDDVQDLSWAPDGTALASGAIENSAVLWDIAAGRGVLRLEGHKHFVQGCAWDPGSKFLVTQSADRTCRVFGPRPPVAGRKAKWGASAGSSCAATAKDFVCQHVLSKGPASMQQGDGKAQRPPLFADEHILTFFRRLSWSPDGAFLAVPAGVYQRGASADTGYTTHLYARGQWEAPVAHLPALSSPVVAIAFCPRLFALRPRVPCDAATLRTDHAEPCKKVDASGGSSRNSPVTDGARPAELPQPPAAEAELGFVRLPYRMVFAVATLDSVFLYDTQGMQPIAVVGALHMDPITDVAWSCDASLLAVASRDGYCSLTAFEAGELGEPADAGAVPPHIARRMASAAKTLAPRAPQKQAQAAKAKQPPGAYTPAAPLSSPANQQPEATAAVTDKAPKQRIVPQPVNAPSGQPAVQQRRIQPQPVGAGSAAEQSAGQTRRIQPKPVIVGAGVSTAAAPAAAAAVLRPPAAAGSGNTQQAAAAAAASADWSGGSKRDAPAAAAASAQAVQPAKKLRQLTPVPIPPAVPQSQSVGVSVSSGNGSAAGMPAGGPAAATVPLLPAEETQTSTPRQQTALPAPRRSTVVAEAVRRSPEPLPKLPAPSRRITPVPLSR